ncbi:LysR family transcriptional regulator [Hoeflea ulvae]|uniref:LysR family transcriptional regulator n=1 Tax=Hoeflea ulvae TaxID=2983764 RepID=A0ABT3YAS2_9HYPH|nr:LysR family transcriptional regulator [Hoeflea ulvae]MCY0092865.1 LysR family transcriptional regulator [Hoeflea ulvae]
MDWNLLRSFLAVAETGSLTAAAARLGMSQPSIGRHISELERQLDTPLFRRGPRGQQLSERGLDLMAQVSRMGEAADAVSRIAFGRSENLAGTVRVTASEVIGALVLPAMITELRRQEPSIEVEIVASNSVGNLLRRDADIAIRMVRPHQLDLLVRHIADIPLIPCASAAYFARAGKPQRLEDLLTHDLIGYDRSDEIIEGFAKAGVTLNRSAFKLRSDSQLVLWQAIRAGAGIHFGQVPLVASSPDLETCLEDMPLPRLETYLTLHSDVRNSPRIRFVADYLYQAMRDYASLGRPG